MNDLESYLKLGIIAEVYNAKRHLFIWEQVANEYDFLIAQDQETKQLYSYIQQSAQLNFVLHTTRLYDEPSKKYPTRSIKSFLKLISDRFDNFPAIVEKITTKNELIKYKAPPELIASVDLTNPSAFPKLFHRWVFDKYNDARTQDLLKNFKIARDKFIAHNEHIEKTVTIDIEHLKILLEFASEILQVFSKAYFHSHYDIDRDVDRACFFIINALDNLKEKRKGN